MCRQGRSVIGLLCLGVLILGTGVAHGQSTGSVVGWGARVLQEPSALEDLVAVSGDEAHSLGLRSDGTIVAWGENSRGQCDVPAPNAGFSAIATGGLHSLGLKADSTIVGWGWNQYGQCDIPAPNAGFVGIAACYWYSLGVKSDGTIVAWGNGPGAPPDPNAGFAAVAAGYGHALGLKADGTIVAWGDNSAGQCNVPAPNADFVAIAAGSYHSLGLKADGTIVAWGLNEDGQCDVPAPNASFVAVAAGAYHSLGLKSDESIVAWGWNAEGECTVPDPNDDFVKVAAGGGGYHSLGLKADGTMRAWGSNNTCQCNVPPPNADFTEVAGGYYHGLGLRSDGTIATWGQNNAGQCNVPAPNSGFVATAGGGDHSLGLKSDGTIVAWGQNAQHQSEPPVENSGFVAIAAGPFHNLGLKSDGTIAGWGGDNLYGEINWDDGTTDYVAVAAGEKHSLGLRSDGTIVARGWNLYGQCDVPAPNTDFVAIAAGLHHSLGVKSDGSIVAWGRNNLGQCDVPAPNDDFVTASGGGYFSLGLKSDGTIVAWGTNTGGQCDIPEPNVGWVTVAAGYNGGMGLRNPVVPPLTGTRSVGPTGDYASLTAAGMDIMDRGLDGPLALELEPAYVSSVETFPLTVGAFPGSDAEHTVTIRPAVGATGLCITSADATGTLDLNGATYVVFDGRPGGTGTPGELTIENTSPSAWAVRFINEASHNTLQHLTLKGVTSGSTTNGVVHFGTTTGANGNDVNTIDHCDIRDGATTPSILVYSAGTTTTTAQHNSDNVISNCNLCDFFNATGTHTGISLSSGNQDWTIQGNSFYETVARNMTGTGTLEWQAVAAFSSSTNGLRILDNYVGGSAPHCGGSPLTYTGNATLRALRLTVGTATPTSIQGNTFRNISVTSTSGSSSQTMVGLVTGSFHVGTEAPNSIGRQDAAGDISFALSNTSTAAFAGISAGTGTPGTIVISNNMIGGISILQVGGAGTATARGISLATNSGSGDYTVTGNTIGSPEVPGSFTSANGALTGIYGAASGSYSLTANVSGNTVAHLSYLGTTSTAYPVRGVSLSGNGGGVIADNTIHDLSSASTSVGTGGTASVVGIVETPSGSTGGRAVLRNRVYGLTNTAATATTGVTGISVSGPVSTHTVAGNLVHSLALQTSGIHVESALQIQGININAGTATCRNNMVRLGLDAAGNSITTGYAIGGIVEESSRGANVVLGNSVYLGGDGIASVGRKTSALISSVGTDTRSYQDNVLTNARSNASGTGRNYAVVYEIIDTAHSSDYNDLYAPGSGGCVAATLAGGTLVDYPTLVEWQAGTGRDAHSISADPHFVNAGGGAASVDLHVDTSIFPPSSVANAGTSLSGLTDDYDGQVRGTPPDLGADDFPNFTIEASAGSHGQISPAGSLLVNGGTDLTFVMDPDSCYAVADVLVDGGSVGSVTLYTFIDIQSDHTIEATFAPAIFTITATAGPGGTITPSGAIPVACGGSQQFDVQALDGFAIQQVTVDGVPQGPIPMYLFSNVTADHAIDAAFLDTAAPQVTLAAPNGGEIWLVGSNQTIAWTATDNAGVTSVDLAYSTDGGASYPFVIGTGLGNTGSYPWVVPDTPSTTCRVRATARDAVGNTAADASDADFEIQGSQSAVADALLGEREVVGVCPNPTAAGAAQVLFRLTQTGAFAVGIFDVSGRQVRQLGSGSAVAGVYALAWDGRDERGAMVPGGLYMVRFVAEPGQRITKRFVLVR